MANSLNMIEMALAVVKDQAMIINLRKIEDAQRDFLLAEADQNRNHNRELIRSIAKIDVELIKLKNDFIKGKSNLDSESIKAIEDLIAFIEKDLQKKRKELCAKKI